MGYKIINDLLCYYLPHSLLFVRLILFLPLSVTHVSRYFRITQSLFFLFLSRMSLDISGSLNLLSSSFCHACLSIFQDHSISFLPLSVTHVSRYFRITQSLFFLFLSRTSLSIFQDHSISFLPLSVTHVSRYFRITQSLFFLSLRSQLLCEIKTIYLFVLHLVDFLSLSVSLFLYFF